MNIISINYLSVFLLYMLLEIVIWSVIIQEVEELEVSADVSFTLHCSHATCNVYNY